MNRSELVAKLAERFDLLTVQDADAAVATILQGLAEVLSQGRRVEIRVRGAAVSTGVFVLRVWVAIPAQASQCIFPTSACLISSRVAA